MSTFEAYFLFVFLPNFSKFCIIVGISLLAFSSVVCFPFIMAEDEPPKRFKRGIAVALILIFLGMMIPTKKELLTIYSVKYISGAKQ